MNPVTYSHTVSPSGVTSKMRPVAPSVMRVLPLGWRSAALVMKLMNASSTSAWYCQTISSVAGSTSRMREWPGPPRRCEPLSKSSTFPLGSIVKWCWCDVTPGPHRHSMSPLSGLTITTVSVWRKLTSQRPSGATEIELACVHSRRRSSGHSTSSL